MIVLNNAGATMPTMIDLVTDPKWVPQLASALQTIETEPKLKEDLGKLYNETSGFLVRRDDGRRVRCLTVHSCSRIGTRLTKILQPVGRHDEMMWIGELIRHRGKERWVMRPQIRKAIDELGWFAEVPVVGLETGYSNDELHDYQFAFREQVLRASNDSSAIRKARLKIAALYPTRLQVKTWIFNRNPDVVVEVLARANGKCEHCGASAPFNRAADGTPYLEVHHKVRLIDHGEDSVKNAMALCPNCHRKLHFGT